MRIPSSSEKSTLIENSIFIISIILLCIAPLIRSGRMYSALLILEILGITLITLAAWNPLHQYNIPKIIKITIWSIIVIPCLYLLPLPLSIWQNLPGHELYTESLNIVVANGYTDNYLTYSLIPYRTVSTLLSLLPVIGIFLAALILPRTKIIFLVYLFLGIASFEAALGLIQYGSGAEWAFWWSIEDEGRNATGTYPNRDHFAALMELALPLSLSMIAYNIGNKRHKDDENPYIFNETVIFFTISVLIILAGIFSRSRAGVLLIIVGILLSSISFGRHAGGKQNVGLNVIIISVTIGIATSIGLVPVLNRFAVNPMEDARWQIFDAVWVGIKQFFPLGSGPGTFQSVFLAFQPPSLQKFINHAHNDYLELFFETSIFGILLIALLVITYIYGWFNLRSNQWGRFQFIQVATGISLLLMSLHGFMDFNFHTPANVIFFAFLSGIFLHQGAKKSPHN